MSEAISDPQSDPTRTERNPGWWAAGLLFENCSCQSVCPGHVHFDQLCTKKRCNGYWAIQFKDGEFDGVQLGGVNAVIAYDAPQHMIEGGWTEGILLDAGASAAQREAIEAILTGRAGGPWAVLARFVDNWVKTQVVAIDIRDEGRVKRVVIDGVLDSSIEAIRGRDRDEPVTFENMFNQIHATSQVIAQGATMYGDGEIRFSTQRSHALYSDFHWSVSV